MENPNTHNDTIKLIQKTIDEYNDLLSKGFCGTSLEVTIYRKLLEAGLLK